MNPEVQHLEMLAGKYQAAVVEGDETQADRLHDALAVLTAIALVRAITRLADLVEGLQPPMTVTSPLGVDPAAIPPQ